MAGSEFVTKLKAENEAILAKIDELPLSSDTTGAPVIPSNEVLPTKRSLVGVCTTRTA